MKYLTLATANGQDYICVSSTPVSGGSLPSNAKCVRLKDKTSLEGYCPPPGTQIAKENYFEYDSSSQEIVFYQAQAGANCQVNYNQLARVPRTVNVNSFPFEIKLYASKNSIPRFYIDQFCYYHLGLCFPLYPSIFADPYVFMVPLHHMTYVGGTYGSTVDPEESNYFFRLNTQTGILEKRSIREGGTTVPIGIPAFNAYKNYLYFVTILENSYGVKIYVSQDYGNTFTSFIVPISIYTGSIYYRGSLSLPDKQIFYFYIVGSTVYGSYAIYSTDGLSGWTETQLSPVGLFSGMPYHEIVSTGSKLFLSSGGIYTSTDGFSWAYVPDIGISTSAAFVYSSPVQRKIGNYIYFGGKPSYIYNITSDTFAQLYDFHVLDYVNIRNKIYAILISSSYSRSYSSGEYIYDFQGTMLLDIETNKLYDMSSMGLVSVFEKGILFEFGYAM